jgi:hypothetical protein
MSCGSIRKKRNMSRCGFHGSHQMRMLGSLTLMMHLIPQNSEERGTGVIITDSTGTMIQAQAYWYDHLEDAFQAEALATAFRLMMARETLHKIVSLNNFEYKRRLVEVSVNA